MLAARMYDRHDIRLEQIDRPSIGENELLVQVKCVGICGTDLRMIRNGAPGISESSPRILGHEFSGVIAEVGARVKHYRKGMRVGIAPNMGCGVCRFCIAGDQHLCENYRAIGIHMDGAMAEYVVIPERAVTSGNVMVLPDHVTFEEAAINEPLSCVYNGLTRCPVKPGDNVLIIGAGPIGMMQALFARLAGAAKIMIANRSPARLELCKKIDGSLIPIESANLREEVRRLTGGAGADVCIVANSSPEAQSAALELTAVNGRVNFFGGLPEHLADVSLNSNLIHYKQLLVTGTTKANNRHFAETLRFISEGLLDPKPLVSARFSIREVREAIAYAMAGSGLKTVITFEDA